MNTMPQHQGGPGHTDEQDEGSILNEELLAQYEAMDEGVTEDPLLPKLIGIFQKHFPEHLERLESGLHKQDESEVTYVIHKMLGMAHNVGALRLSEFLMVMENAEPEAKLNLGQADVALLQQEFKAAAAALDDYLN